MDYLRDGRCVRSLSLSLRTADLLALNHARADSHHAGYDAYDAASISTRPDDTFYASHDHAGP